MNELIRTAEQHLTSAVPTHLEKKLLWLPDDARSMGIHIQAGKGSGKSRLIGRLIAWFDFIRGMPFVLFDPHGPSIDNFLDKIIRMPREIQEQLWPRVMYVDMSGHYGQVVPFPLYYRLGGESLYEISQRYLDVVRKLDPYLQTASVEGWNPLWRTGTYTGMLLAALNYQITEAENLLRNPAGWERRFREVLAAYPEAQPAVSYFRELKDAKENLRNRRTESFFNKISIFNLDPAMQAMFGASTPGVDWENVMLLRQAVLLDFRQERDVERRRFKMIWAFNYFLEFVKQRGAGRQRPIGLIIDELASLFSLEMMTGEIMGRELDELINVIARNYRVWLTIAHQEQFQLTVGIQKTLMTMGTQILGLTSDWEAALSAAKQFYRYDPYWIKKTEPVGNIDIRTVEFTVDEQFQMQSEKFRDLGRFQFLIRPAAGEGNVWGGLRKASIENLDRGLYPNDNLVSQARALLMERRGKSIEAVLAEIADRLAQRNALPRPQTTASNDAAAAEDVPPLWTY